MGDIVISSINTIFIMKGMIVMANTYCHEGYCDLTGKKRVDGEKVTFTEKLLILGAYGVFVAVISALVLYSAYHGIYLDPALLQ